MKVFFKYVLKSMTEKKGRFLLLIIAISMSTALVVASAGMIDIILDSMVGPQEEAYEGRDIIIHSTDESSCFFRADGIHESGIRTDSIIKEIYIKGSMVLYADTDEEELLTVTTRGREMADINKEIMTQGSLEEFHDSVCMISERTADNLKLGLGDSLKISIGGETKSLTIVAVSAASGAFYSDSSSIFTVFVPYEYLSGDLGQEGKYNMILANSAENTVQAGIDLFNADNTAFTAELLFDEAAVKSQISSYTSLFYVMLAVVAFMSAIIIYSSFKLIITERLSTIGTFMSQGATTAKVKFILYLESFTYGLIGALLGTGLGILGLLIINRCISPLREYGIYNEVVIQPVYLYSGALFAILLSVISAVLPVRSISKLQVKDIILNDVRISKAIGWRKCILGMILLGASIAAYAVFQKNLGFYSLLLIVTSMTGVLFLYPKLVDLLSLLLFRLLRGRSKSVIYAVNNLRTSKILLGNISLIIISLVSIIVITSLGTQMITVVTEAYSEMECDIQIDHIATIRENEGGSTADYLMKQLENLGIDRSQMNLMNYQSGTLINPETNREIIMTTIGMDLATFTDYLVYLKLDQPAYREYLDDFEQDFEGVIITTALNKVVQKEVGDTIEITCNGITQNLTISGIINAKLYNNGYIVLIKNETMKALFAIPSANMITFLTEQDVEVVMDALKPILRETGAVAQTRDEMCEINLKNNEFMVIGLSVFSYMAIVIAAFGIINNVMISFIQRKNEFAVLSSVGMEDSGRNKILLFESAATVTWAMLITSIYSVFSVKLVSIFTKAIGFDMEIPLDYKSLPIIFGVSLVIVTIATLPVLLKSRKLSIIQELKYE